MEKLCYISMENYSYEKLGDILIERTFLTNKKVLSVTNIVEGDEGEYYPYKRSTDIIRKVYEPFPIICVSSGDKLIDLLTRTELTNLPALKENGLQIKPIRVKREEVETRLQMLSSDDAERYESAIRNLNNNISLRYDEELENNSELLAFEKTVSLIKTFIN